MSEPYKCGKCGGKRFHVDTEDPPNGNKALAVLVQCKGCSESAEAASVTEAFQKIAKKEEEAPRE